MTYHCRGFILRREIWRESARLYTIYTREHGKLMAVGRGTRKVLSKLGAHLEPYGFVDLHLARGRKTETICGADMLRSPEPLVQDDFRYLAASFTAEAIDHFVKMGDPDEELWRLIEAWYGDLTVMPENLIHPRLSAFIWRFMAHLGYRPKLDACAECGRPLRFETARFLPMRGAVACQVCHLDERALVGCETLEAAAMEDLRAILNGAVPASRGLGEAGRAALALLEAHLDRPLTSLPFMRTALSGARGILEPIIA